MPLGDFNKSASYSICARRKCPRAFASTLAGSESLKVSARRGFSGGQDGGYGSACSASGSLRESSSRIWSRVSSRTDIGGKLPPGKLDNSDSREMPVNDVMLESSRGQIWRLGSGIIREREYCLARLDFPRR